VKAAGTWLCALVLALGVASGCGGDDGDEEPGAGSTNQAVPDDRTAAEERIRVVIDQFVAATKSGDTDRICEIATDPVVVEAEDRSCKDFAGDPESAVTLSVDEIEINGTTATVNATSNDGERFSIRMEKDPRQGWLFGGIASSGGGQ
jgi:hypothetical protein